jgi:hypothetical protein
VKHKHHHVMRHKHHVVKHKHHHVVTKAAKADK